MSGGSQRGVSHTSSRRAVRKGRQAQGAGRQAWAPPSLRPRRPSTTPRRRGTPRSCRLVAAGSSKCAHFTAAAGGLCTGGGWEWEWGNRARVRACRGTSRPAPLHAHQFTWWCGQACSVAGGAHAGGHQPCSPGEAGLRVEVPSRAHCAHCTLSEALLPCGHAQTLSQHTQPRTHARTHAHTPRQPPNNSPHTRSPQRLVTAIQRRNPDYDPACLSFRDKAGRTPLIICARMNRPNCAKVVGGAQRLRRCLPAASSQQRSSSEGGCLG